jgi:RHS repeat-associated protein
MVKYYYAGTTRVAMRTGYGSGPTGLLWLFGDHLGSASRVANVDGTPYTNGEQRYKPWGEKRYPTIDSGLPTTYRYTGERQETLLSPAGGEGLYWVGSRWLDPSLGRWIQADTVISDPYNPLAYDRYQYVYSNPTKYTDPSGHCTGNPRDPKNQDKACWKRYKELGKRFKNAWIDSSFDIKELLTIQYSLELILKAFENNMNGFKQALGNFAILKQLPGLDSSMAPPGWQSILLADKFSFTNVIHEAGHIFDFHGAGLIFPNPNKYKSEYFVDNFNTATCKYSKGALGCIGNSPPPVYEEYNTVTGGLGAGYYKPSGNPSDYGRSSSSTDDFADAFTFHVLKVNNLSDPLLPYDPVRELFITTVIDSYTH